MFGTIDINVRPIRLAYLVDPGNAAQVREAIRLSSTLWGGPYFPIIPMYKRMPATWRQGLLKVPSAKDVALGYIEAFDPDILVQFCEVIPDYITALRLRVIKPKEIWQHLSGTSISPQFGIGIFELLNDIFADHFKYKPKYPVKVVLPTIPDQYSLLWSSLFGEIPSTLMPVLKRHYFEPLEVDVTDFRIERLRETLAPNVLFPRRICDQGLRHLNRSGLRNGASVYFLDAAKVEDVIDFWNLRAIGRPVIPIAKQLRDDSGLKKLLIDFLKTHRRPWSHNPTVCDFASIIRSRNCTMEEIQEFAQTLKIERPPGDVSDSPFFSLQHWYPRVWDEWARDKDGAVPDDIYGQGEVSLDVTDAKDLRFRFRPLLPAFTQKFSYRGEPRCANEIGFRVYGSHEHLAQVLPKSSGENYMRAISGLGVMLGEWRVGRNGLVKLVGDDFTETRGVPAAESIIFAWLSDLGWKPKLSPAGLLAKQMYRALDGQPFVLRNEKLLGLLEHMNGGQVKRDGSPAEEAKNRVRQERELPVSEVRTRLGAGPQGDGAHNYLVSKGIFTLGPRMQCPNCLRNSWFPLGDIGDTFRCPKCQQTFPAVGNLDSATWCYKTTGPFSVPRYADGAYAVLLTLEFFNQHPLRAMDVTPVLSFTAEAPNKRKLEADFAMLWQESLFGERRDGILFCECKTYGRFEKKDFNRMRYLARTFSGAVLVFSKLGKSLTRAEISGIGRIARAGRKYWKPDRPINPVLVLTGTELLNRRGVPYCWDEGTQKKFRQLGLLNLCNATQQIYLGLPPWEADWHQEWERRRRRAGLTSSTTSQPAQVEKAVIDPKTVKGI
jgi:hypothetical protein